MLEWGESPEAGLSREILEETGLTIAVGPLLAVKGGRRVCTIVYAAEPVGGELKRSAESLEVVWFALDQIPWDDLAFPRHREALQEWVATARGCSC